MLELALIVLVCLSAGLLAAVYVTNPFNRVTVVRLPFLVTDVAAGTVVDKLDRLKVRAGLLWRWFAVIKCGAHILYTRYLPRPRSQAVTAEGIVADVRALRFRPDKLLIISGDHFSPLFVRNLGVFYYPTLDTRIADSPQEWRDRQVVYLQTLAYAFGVFAKRPVPATTIVQTGRYSATPVNFYAYPSDTVYSVLYALAALLGKEAAAPDGYAKPHHTLETRKAC